MDQCSQEAEMSRSPLLESEWTRRSVLKTSLAGLYLLACRVLWPEKATGGGLPPGRLTLYNVQTDEHVTATYRDDSGQYDQSALDDLNHILRCHHSGQSTRMDIRVIEIVNAVQKQLRRNPAIHIVSGYRSPEYNDHLVRTSRRAVKNSYHTLGQAIDVQVPGVSVKVVRDAALRVGRGGVGYYPRSKFIHLDSGPFRWW